MTVSSSIFLIEDHSLVRGGLKRLIQTSASLTVAGEAESVELGLPEVIRLKPDVVTLDLMLPGLSGRPAVEKLLAALPGLKLMVVSARTEAAEIQSLLQAGVLGYVSKDSTSEDFLRSLEAVARGESCLGPAAANALARSMRVGGNGNGSVLSERLIQVLSFIAEGKKTKEIAELLFLSPKTIEKYRGQILRKLDCRNQIEAIEKAKKLNILQNYP